MKRKVILLSLALMLVTVGVVSAASKWGTFEGFNIVKLIINGKEIKPKDTPPVILKGRTMIPLSMLEQAGLQATWNGKEYTVSVKSTSGFVNESEFIEMNKAMQSHRAFITFMDQIELTSISNDLLSRSTTYDQVDQSLGQVDRIDIDALYGWSDILGLLGVSESAYFESVAGSVEKAKSAMYEGKTQVAHSHIISAKTTMNTIYTQIDKNYTNTFAVKNQERFK